MSTAPRVCVVAATHQRAWLVPTLVEALRSQSMTDFEAVLVDDGSTDGTVAALEAAIAGDLRFRVERLDPNGGPARARNHAWRSTDAPWVAFTDDDCTPGETWLAELLDTAEASGASVVQGRTMPPDERPDAETWFGRSPRVDRWSGRFETCNLLVERRLLDQLGGFDEGFRMAMGEDTDLGLRAVATGAGTAFAAGAHVEHRWWAWTLRDDLRQRRRYAETVGLVRRHPEARDFFRHRYVSRGVHLLVWALVPVAAVAVDRRAPHVPVLAVAAWVGANAWRTRDRPFPLPSRLWYSTQQFVSYGYETACFARESVRHRTLVL